jgi:hypothetical protein
MLVFNLVAPHFTIPRPQKKRKAQAGAEAASAAVFAIGAFIRLHGLKKNIQKNSDLAWVQI